MNTKTSTFNCYKGELFWKSQMNNFTTMAYTETKAKQNMIAQLAKILNLQVSTVASNFKRNPTHIKIQKEF